MKSLKDVCNSLRTLCFGPRRRRGGRGLHHSGDALEPRQLMTVIPYGGMEVESNNSMSQANQLQTLEPVLSTSVSSRFFGHVGYAGDSQDFFKLDLSQNVRNAMVMISHSTRQSLDLQLLNSSGRVVAVGNRPSLMGKYLQVASLPAGTYYIRIARGSVTAASDWSVLFTGTRAGGSKTTPQPPASSADAEPNNSRSQAGSIGTLTQGVTTVVSGSLTGSDPEDWYRVPLKSPGKLTVDLRDLAADLDLEVLDSSGNSLRTSTRIGSVSETITLDGLAAGDYFIRVTRYSNASSSYTLSAVSSASQATTPTDNTSMASAADLGTVSPGPGVNAGGSLEGGPKWYRFQTTSNWNGTLTIEGSGGATTQQQVSNLAAGTYYLTVSTNLIGSKFLAYLRDANGVSLQNFTVARSGDTFRLTVAVQNNAPARPLEGVDMEDNDSRSKASRFGSLRSGSETALKGSVGRDEREDWFVFTLDRQSDVGAELSMENWRNGAGVMNSLDKVTHLQLCDQFGNVLRDSTPIFGTLTSGLRTVSMSALSAGTYYLRVFRSSTGMSSPYRLSLTPRTV